MSLPTPYYQRGPVTLFHGDCLELLPHLPRVDAVVTDPPYGIAFKSHGMLFRQSSEIANDEAMSVGQSVVDWAISQELCIVAFCSPGKPWGGNWRNWLAWDKGGHVGIGGDRATCWKRSWEMVAVANNPPLNGQRDEGVLRFNAVSPPPSGHVAEKPLPLMEYLIEKVTQPSDTVFEPFAGSGSTVAAALRTGRQCIACELDAEWCEYIAARCDRELDQKRLPFDAPKRTETQQALFAEVTA